MFFIYLCRRVLALSCVTLASLTATSLQAQSSKSLAAEPGAAITVSTLGDELAYDVVEIRARAGTEFTMTFVNKSAGMPHNVVFVNGDADVNPVGIAALQAAKNDYIPENELERIFAYTAMAGPGETVSVTVTVPEKPGIYPYVCTYPGHFTVMQGRLVVR
jgi:azurin